MNSASLRFANSALAPPAFRPYSYNSSNLGVWTVCHTCDAQCTHPPLTPLSHKTGRNSSRPISVPLSVSAGSQAHSHSLSLSMARVSGDRRSSAFTQIWKDRDIDRDQESERTVSPPLMDKKCSPLASSFVLPDPPFMGRLRSSTVTGLGSTQAKATYREKKERHDSV
jgi:hypothetical protein